MLEILILFTMVFYQIILSFVILTYELTKYAMSLLGLNIPNFENASTCYRAIPFFLMILSALVCIIIF